ncbi:MAG: hypothetical protein RI922_1925, partial [Bacteroidota bacterium]
MKKFLLLVALTFAGTSAVNAQKV